MEAAKRAGPGLLRFELPRIALEIDWRKIQSAGDKSQASLLSSTVMLGNEEDFTAAFGISGVGTGRGPFQARNLRFQEK